MQINDKALLVKLSIGVPGNTRRDQTLTKKVEREHNLGANSGRWLKQMYPDEALEPLTKLSTEARTWHYEQSLPWKDDGFRILPTANHFTYTAKIRELRQKFEGLAESHFLAQYDKWVSWAREAHNGTFNQADYPGVEKVRSKFSFETEFNPIPSSEDFRVNFSADEMETIKKDLDTRVDAAVQESNKDLWRRLVEPVQAMVERLSKPDATFRDTLIGNIQAIVGIIPALNLTGDSQLESFRIEIERELSRWMPETLRESKQTREQVAAKAKEILGRMEGYFA